MKFICKQSDGGKDSGVTAYTLFEIKSLGSIMLLHFNSGSREAFHSHAFNALTLWLKGDVTEERLEKTEMSCSLLYIIRRKFSAGRWKWTPRENMHRIVSQGGSWALTFRGPWQKTWQEFKNGEFVTLTHGRQVVSESI